MKKLYTNKNWFEFSTKIKERDSHTCTKCGKNQGESVLQVHHVVYKEGLKPWEYSLSDCITLCKGCHAKEHSIIEPTSDWVLLSIDDLGELSGECERRGCGNPIRYAHYIYHPSWGEMMVGSTCVDHLTQVEQALSRDIIDIYKKISKFVSSCDWKQSITKKGVRFKYATYNYHQIRVYGDNKSFVYQIAIKEKGARWFNYEKVSNVQCVSDILALELGFVNLLGLLSVDNDKELLRDIFRNLKKVHENKSIP